MTVSSVLLGLAGVVLLFAPREYAQAAGLGETEGLATAMWGIGMLSFGIVNWTARASILGGIYGRAVVLGNQIYSTTGFLVLLQAMREPAVSPGWPLIAVVVVLGLHAVFFFLLLTRSPKSPEEGM